MRVWLLASTVVLMASLNGIAIRHGVQFVSPVVYIEARLIVGSILFLVVHAVWLGGYRNMTARPLFAIAGVGVLGFVVSFLFVYTGLQYTTAAHCSLIYNLRAVALTLLAVPILGERIVRSRALWLGGGLVGVATINLDDAWHFNAAYLKGDGLVFAGMLCFSLFNALIRKLSGRHHPFTLATLAYSAAAVVLLGPGVSHFDRAQWSAAPLSFWLAFSFLATVGSVVAHYCFFALLKALPAATVGAIGYLIPLVTVGLEYCLLDETVSRSFFAGTAIVLASVYLFNYKSRVASL